MRPTKASMPLPLTYATEQFHVTMKYSTVDILLYFLGNIKTAKNTVMPFPTRTCVRDLMGKRIRFLKADMHVAHKLRILLLLLPIPITHTCK